MKARSQFFTVLITGLVMLGCESEDTQPEDYSTRIDFQIQHVINPDSESANVVSILSEITKRDYWFNVQNEAHILRTKKDFQLALDNSDTMNLSFDIRVMEPDSSLLEFDELIGSWKYLNPEDELNRFYLGDWTYTLDIGGSGFHYSESAYLADVVEKIDFKYVQDETRFFLEFKFDHSTYGWFDSPDKVYATISNGHFKGLF